MVVVVAGSTCEAKATQHKTDTISFDPEHQNGILGFMAFSRCHGYGALAVAIIKFESSCFCRG